MDWRALGLVASVVAGCRRTPAPAPAPAPEASVAPSVEAAESPAAAAIASVLASVRAKVSLAAPAWQTQPFAFGDRLFVALTGDGVRAFSLPDGAPLFDEPLAAPRGIVTIAGGSVVVAGGERALRADPDAKKAVRLPAIPWLPGTLLLPERRDSAFVWAAQTSGRLFVRQKLDLDPLHAFDASVTLEGYAGGAVTSLRDGALFYQAPDAVCRALPESRPRVFKTPFAVWRLLPGRRVDQAWAIAADGSVELWLIGERLVVQERFVVGAAPFDAAANGEYLALVVVDEPGDAPRRFRLLVFENDGKPVLERVLPPGAPESGPDWEEQAVANRHVALADGAPWVAVGGPDGFEVSRLPGGARVFSR